MGQYKIYEFLKENEGFWYNSAELSHEFGITPKNVNRAISQLLKVKLVEVKIGYVVKGESRWRINLYRVVK